MDNLPYRNYYVTVKQDIVTDEFTIGYGAKIYLPNATSDLIRLLRNVYHENKASIELSPATATYLFSENGSEKDTLSPCVILPTSKIQVPRFFAPRQHGK